MTPVGPEPGWYFDPDCGDHERFWNGEAWTEHRRLKPLTSNPPGQRGSEARLDSRNDERPQGEAVVQHGVTYGDEPYRDNSSASSPDQPDRYPFRSRPDGDDTALYMASGPTPAAAHLQQRRKHAKARQLIPHYKLGVLTKIGQGGQGVVYRAPNVKTRFAASMVYKEYKTHARTCIDFTALAAMPALVEEALTYAQAKRLISITAWPCAIVEDADTPTGFVMPAIPDQFFIPLTTVKGVSTTTAEFQHLLNHPTVLEARGINVDDAQRYTLLREVASALAFLHKHGVCVGDISPKNLLFSLTPHEAIYFIDCDAMCINAVSALAQVETPGWDAPAGEERATIYTDTYKLGLLALRLLVGDHDTKNPQHLPPTTSALLRQIITDTLRPEPHSRPLPESWTYVLGRAIEETQHRKATTPTVSATPIPPPTPVLRSRPPAQSPPSVRPPTAPPSAPHPQTRKAACAPSLEHDQASRGGAFWLHVGIDPIRIVTSAHDFLTLRCYLDDVPIFLGNGGMINVFRSGPALRQYLASDPPNDMSSLCTYRDVTLAANDGSLPVDDVTDENFYTLKRLAKDIAAGTRHVDCLQLELAVELLSDVGIYVEDTIVEDYLRSGQPLGDLVESVVARNYVRSPRHCREEASSQWMRLEEFLESRLRLH